MLNFYNTIFNSFEARLGTIAAYAAMAVMWISALYWIYEGAVWWRTPKKYEDKYEHIDK